MGRFRSVAQVAAFFIITVAGNSLAYACEDCERVPVAASSPDVPTTWGNVGRIDVTSAVDSAAALLVDAVRGLRRWSHFGAVKGEVDITQQALGSEAVSNEELDESNEDSPALGLGLVDDMSVSDPEHALHVSGFQYDPRWQLTYRSDGTDAISQPAQSDRFPAMNTTLDDSTVVGLRFQMKYGWK